MTVLVANIVQATDTFGQWLAKTNQIAVAMSNSAVTTNSNTAFGNAAISGTFSANALSTSNTGELRAGQTSSNLIANATSLVIQTSTTSNTIYTSSGILIDGVSQFSKYMISMGNTVITSANLTIDKINVDSNVQIGSNTTVGNNYITTYNINSQKIDVSANAYFGDNQANVEINRYGVSISDNPLGTYIVNSYMTATDLWIQNIHANTIQIYGGGSTQNTAFNNNTYFYGDLNYFQNGLGSGGDVDIVGAGKHFSHGYFSNNISSSNTTFMYNGAGGNSNFTRNIFQNTIGQAVFTNTIAEAIQLNSGTLSAVVYPNATPGTSSSTGNTVIFSANTTKAYVANAFGVGGITSPQDALHVEGAVRLESSGNTGHIRLLAPNTNVNFDLILPAKKGKIKQVLVVIDEINNILDFADNPGSDKDDVDIEARSLGVGTNAPGGGGNKGEIRASGNIIAYYSDERLKEVLGPIENALGKVLQLDGFYYKANDTAKELGYSDEKIQVGISAQKVQEVLPHAVFPAPIDEKYLTVQYDKLVPLLIEAIKELKAEVDRLKNGN